MPRRWGPRRAGIDAALRPPHLAGQLQRDNAAASSVGERLPQLGPDPLISRTHCCGISRRRNAKKAPQKRGVMSPNHGKRRVYLPRLTVRYPTRKQYTGWKLSWLRNCHTIAETFDSVPTACRACKDKDACEEASLTAVACEWVAVRHRSPAADLGAVTLRRGRPASRIWCAWVAARVPPRPCKVPSSSRPASPSKNLRRHLRSPHQIRPRMVPSSPRASMRARMRSFGDPSSILSSNSPTPEILETTDAATICAKNPTCHH
jgi:hypothetical protein